ncbi:MAG: hypothetical protein Q8P67_24405, partial [archaeon]|nr:hypothetical protein [archaeon]
NEKIKKDEEKKTGPAPANGAFSNKMSSEKTAKKDKKKSEAQGAETDTPMRTLRFITCSPRQQGARVVSRSALFPSLSISFARRKPFFKQHLTFSLSSSRDEIP